MTKPHKFYLKHMNKKTGYRATWDPGKPLKVGYVGTLNRFGHFTVYTTLEKEGITPDVDIDPSSAELDYSSTDGLSIVAKAAGTAPSVGSVLTQADAGFTIDMKSDKSVVFKIAGYKTHQIINIKDITDAIIKKYQDGNWDEDWLIVTELMEADSATIIISNSSNCKLELRAKADIGAEELAITNAELDLKVAREVGSTLKFITVNNVTPLYKLIGVSRPFEEEEEVEVPKRYELKEIEFQESEVEEENISTVQ